MSDNEVQHDADKGKALVEQLAQANETIARMSEELDDLQIEQRLTHKLAAAGAIDLEAAVLVAKTRVEGKSETQIDSCIARLRKEKEYLFGGSGQLQTPVGGPRRTGAVKDRMAQGQAALEQAAKRAAKTGSRIDLMRYLKLRRSVM